MVCLLAQPNQLPILLSHTLTTKSSSMVWQFPAACSTLLVARFRVVSAVYCMPCFNCCCVCAASLGGFVRLLLLLLAVLRASSIT